MCISLEMRRDCNGEDYLFELQNVVEWRMGDVERSRRAISDARHECVAQYVQWHDEQGAH